MLHDTETGHVTGTKDKDYNLVWFVQSCLDNALRMEIYRQDAEREGDNELVELFTKAQAESKKGAELGKQLLAKRLGEH
jgi:hypothetical protein